MAKGDKQEFAFALRICIQFIRNGKDEIRPQQLSFFIQALAIPVDSVRFISRQYAFCRSGFDQRGSRRYLSGAEV
jgi:hypothetical protein